MSLCSPGFIILAVSFRGEQSILGCRLIFFDFGLQLELSPFLRQRENNIAWCTVFLNTVAKPAPAIAMAEEDPYEREKHSWWKTKKWSYFNLNRLYIRYAPVWLT